MLGSPNHLPGSETRVLLLLTRPGHELFVHGWMEKLRPLVLMLTDGSSSRGSALTSATRTIRTTQSRIGNLFGRFTDRGLHQSLLMNNPERFVSLAEEIADLLVTEEIDWVIGESGEGHSPGADVCRILLDAASGLVSRRLNHLRNYDFSLRSHRSLHSSKSASRQIELEIEGESWQRKRQAILAAPGMGHLLQQSAEEVDRWKREVLQLAQPWQIMRLGETESFEYAPQLESAPIRFREHILPLAETLRLTAACGRAVA